MDEAIDEVVAESVEALIGVDSEVSVMLALAPGVVEVSTELIATDAKVELFEMSVDATDSEVINTVDEVIEALEMDEVVGTDVSKVDDEASETEEPLVGPSVVERVTIAELKISDVELETAMVVVLVDMSVVVGVGTSVDDDMSLLVIDDISFVIVDMPLLTDDDILLVTVDNDPVVSDIEDAEISVEVGPVVPNDDERAVAEVSIIDD